MPHYIYRTGSLCISCKDEESAKKIAKELDSLIEYEFAHSVHLNYWPKIPDTVMHSKIQKLDIYGDIEEEFEIGDKVCVEDYGWGIITQTLDPDGDLDDEGRTIGIPARAYVLFPEENIELFSVNYIYKNPYWKE